MENLSFATVWLVVNQTTCKIGQVALRILWRLNLFLRGYERGLKTRDVTVKNDLQSWRFLCHFTSLLVMHLLAQNKIGRLVKCRQQML